MVIGTAARVGFKLIQQNSGSILATVGLGSAIDMAWDWVFGPSSAQREQQELVQELQSVRTQLAEPGLDPAEAMELAQRDSQIQDALQELGIVVEADFQPAKQLQDIQANTMAAGAAFSKERANITRADTKLLMDVKRAMRTISQQFGGPKSSLPDTVAALRLLMGFDNDELRQLGSLIHRLEP